MRINVTGNAGSGKTTLAGRLAARLSLPLVEMDQIVWEPGWRPAPPELRRARLALLLEPDSWVVDGVSRTARRQADLIVFLDFPPQVCAWRCLKRNWRYLFRSRPGLPQGCPEWRVVGKLAVIIANFSRCARPRILQDMARPGLAGVVVRSAADLAAFEASIPELSDAALRSRPGCPAPPPVPGECGRKAWRLERFGTG